MQLIGQSIKGHRASDSECPMAVHAEPVAEPPAGGSRVRVRINLWGWGYGYV